MSVPPPEKGRNYFVHESSFVDEGAIIGEGTKIWHFSHIMADVTIGSRCNFGQNVFIARGVKIGNHVKVQNNVSIYSGVEIEDDVFLGPSCVFTNILHPRARIDRHAAYEKTLIRKGATIGANATILCGIELGCYCFIGAGAVVTKPVPDYALMIGVPARQQGWVGRHGLPLSTPDKDGMMVCPESGFAYKEIKPGQVRCLDLDEEKSLPHTQNIEIPLLDLKAQYDSIQEEMEEAILGVMASQCWIGGPKVAELEEKMASLCRCRFAVGVSSGTDALLSALISLDIGPGDEVITTPFTFFATVGSILRVGAKPVFVDMDPETFQMDPQQLQRAITLKTKAILPVHLFGRMVDMDPVMKVADSNNLSVVEDAAQAIASEYKGQRAGSIGTIGCFSFYPSKNLGGIGDGGMVVTNDEALYKRLTILRNQGSSPKYHHLYIGGNFRLDAIQAAALLVKLPYLNQWISQRRSHAAYYDLKFKNTPISTPKIDPNHFCTYHQYCIRTKHRDALFHHLKSKKIGCEIYYPLPMHLQPCLSHLGYQSGDFPMAEKAAKEVLAIPIYPELTQSMQDRVVEEILAFLGEVNPLAKV